MYYAAVTFLLLHIPKFGYTFSQCITNIETEQCTTQRGKGRKQDRLKKENYCSSKCEGEETAYYGEEADVRATKKLGHRPLAKKREKVTVVLVNYKGCKIDFVY